VRALHPRDDERSLVLMILLRGCRSRCRSRRDAPASSRHRHRARMPAYYRRCPESILDHRGCPTRRSALRLVTAPGRASDYDQMPRVRPDSSASCPCSNQRRLSSSLRRRPPRTSRHSAGIASQAGGTCASLALSISRAPARAQVGLLRAGGPFPELDEHRTWGAEGCPDRSA